jgi:hypothetical protein
MGVAGVLAVNAPGAEAACGVLEQTATGTVAANAVAKADRQMKRQLNALKKQHGKKLSIQTKAVSCVGGDGGIDAQGNRVKAYNRCTVTQPFCVNP